METLSAAKKWMTSGDNWMSANWRPLMAMVYMSVILFDFIVGPIFWTSAQIIGTGTVSLQWSPLTLQSGGLFHVAMGSILGIAAFTRGQEKVQRLKTLESLAADQTAVEVSQQNG